MRHQDYSPLAAWLATGMESNLQQNGEAMPAVATVVGGHPVLLLVPFGDDDKTEMMATALLALRAVGGSHIALCIDSFVSGPVEPGAEALRPSEDPAAQDGLVLAEMNPSWAEPKLWTRTYGRADDGTLTWQPWEATLGVSSWLTGLLDWAVRGVPPVPNEDTRRLALELADHAGVLGPFVLKGTL